jgi:hypothetical protein
MKHASLLIAVLMLTGAVAVAQEDAPAELTGKVTLMGGETYEGVIEVAEFGVVDGAGIGMDRPESNDHMAVTADGQPTKVPTTEIAAIVADWQKTGVAGAEKWQIQALTITRKDGTTVTGKLHWLLHETTVRIRQADGTIARAHAFPVASADFDPNKLLVKVEIGGAVTAPVGPTETTPTETTPTETTPTEVTPTETTPTETAPTETTPGVTPLPPGPGAPVIATPGKLVLTLICPQCGEKMTIEVTVVAKPGE